MRVSGTFLEDGVIRTGALTCWAEWEAPSKLIERLEPKVDYPSFLVEPIAPAPEATTSKLQNTDPYIFGDRFLYTYCKQMQSKRWSYTKLSNLGSGTLILFGSHLGGDFVLDTVLVVDHSITHSRESWLHDVGGSVSDTYRRVTLERMYADPIPPDVHHRMYFGATPKQPVYGMFSFFPCLPVGEGGPRSFARPRIVLDGIINPRVKQGMKTTPVAAGGVHEAWSSVVRQVEAQGLSLGVAAAEPGQSRP